MNIAVMLAGGTGERMGAGRPKQFIEFAGKPLIVHCLDVYEQSPNIDAIEVAGRFGIDADRAVNYECDSAGTAVNYRALSKAVSRVREADCCASVALGVDWKEEIEADYKKRHRK